MRIKKMVMCGIMVIGILFSQSGLSLAETNANKLQEMKEIHSLMPLWVNAHIVNPSISVSGRSISVSLVISPKDKALKSDGTLYLERYSGGRWIVANSWSFGQTGVVSIRQNYQGNKNERYRSKVVVSVGTERITETSAEVVVD